MLRGRCQASQLDQNILPGELAMRIAAGWDVALDFHGVMKIEEFGGGTERGVDLVSAPNVEGTFPFFMFQRTRNLAVRIFGGKESAIFRGHVVPDVIKRIARNFFEERL